MIEGIIKLSRLDENRVELDWKDVDLYELAFSIKNDLKRRSEEENVAIHIRGIHTKIRGVTQILYEMFFNVCENAIKYNHPGGEVVFTISKMGDYPTVIVEDTGIGIPKEDIDRIFERFFSVKRKSMAAIKCIGVLTSGGDAPGMNAAIRAVTRTAIYNGYSVKGIMRGYKGLVDDEIIDLQSDSVSNIIQQGGTMLKTARSQEFMTPEGRRRAYENMKRSGIDALVVIGGDGSLKGACIFAQEFDVPIVGLPGTIDNDLGGTDATIGYDTALNTIVEAVDKLRDTASSHERLFFVEVMGHTAGYLA